MILFGFNATSDSFKGNLFMIQKLTREKLLELKGVLAQIPEDHFSRPLDVLSGSTLGMHLRHILEFYQCLFRALPGRKLNYDLRQRNREMEVEKFKCELCLAQLISELEAQEADLTLDLTADYSGQGQGREVRITTTYYRELLYNVEHCVHHLAIIRIGMKALNPHINLSEEMGVAASTLRNRKLCAQ